MGDDASDGAREAGTPEGTDLAIVVPKVDTGDAIARLREAGVYDDTRRVREHDDGGIEIPVVVAPDAVAGQVIEQSDPDPRVAGLDDLLAERGFSETEIAAAPNSWAVIGDVVLARFEGCPRREAVGEALLDLQSAETVLDRRGIAGEHREPDVEVVAGSGETETVHAEHGTKYALDLATVMFSPGNKRERVRMSEVVDAGERVLDTFAGIGYFTLPMARAGARITAIERNRVAFRYLIENAPLNGVDEQVRPVRADCRDAVDVFRDGGETFDRVVMGYYDAFEYLDPVLAVVEDGGIVHMHEATPEAELPERPVERLRATASAMDRSIEVLDQRRVKTHSEGVFHVVVDARVG
ncbi:MAG: class I SAM-dependent methyltransferase family protein [Halobacteriales archaeon]